MLYSRTTYQNSYISKCITRFVIGNYTYETRSMTGILEQLKWESLKKRRKNSRFIMLCKGLKCVASIPPKRRTRIHHSLAFQTPLAGTDIYKSIFFPQTIRDWNSPTDISASECADYPVSKFISLGTPGNLSQYLRRRY